MMIFTCSCCLKRFNAIKCFVGGGCSSFCQDVRCPHCGYVHNLRVLNTEQKEINEINETKDVKNIKIPTQNEYIDARTRKILNVLGVETLGDLIKCSQNTILSIPNCGRRTLNKIKCFVESYGLAIQ